MLSSSDLILSRAAEGTDSFAVTGRLQAGDRLHFSLI